MHGVCRNRKSIHLETVKHYYVYKETEKGTQINDDKNAVLIDIIFDTIVRHSTDGLKNKLLEWKRRKTQPGQAQSSPSQNPGTTIGPGQGLTPKAGSTLLGRRVVAHSYVDGSTSRTSHTATGSCDSDCCRCIKGILAILWATELALVIKTSSSLAIGRFQASRVTELQCEEPLQVNKSTITSSTDPP